MATAPAPKKRPLHVVRLDEDGQPAAPGGVARSLLLWFGILGGPVAFGLVRLAGIILISGRCVPPAQGAVLFGLSSSQQRMGIITMVGALVAGAAWLASWHAWRQARRQTEERSGESVRPAPFWALGGLFLSSVFFVLILLTGGLAVGLTTTCAS